MADAVAEEIEDLKKDLTDDFDAKVIQMNKQIEVAQLSGGYAEKGQETLQFQLELLREDFEHQKMPKVSQMEIAAPLQLTHIEQKIAAHKAESKKLFEQMKNIMLA